MVSHATGASTGGMMSEYNWVECDDRTPKPGWVGLVSQEGGESAYTAMWNGEHWCWRDGRYNSAVPSEWLDPTPQPSKLERLAELVDGTEGYSGFRCFGPGNYVKLEGSRADTQRLIAMLVDEAIAHLEQEQVSSYEKAMEAMTMLREKLGLFSDDKPMLADIVLRYLEAQDE